jgi:hypothetical protein
MTATEPDYYLEKNPAAKEADPPALGFSNSNASLITGAAAGCTRNVAPDPSKVEMTNHAQLRHWATPAFLILGSSSAPSGSEHREVAE